VKVKTEILLLLPFSPFHLSFWPHHGVHRNRHSCQTHFSYFAKSAWEEARAHYFRVFASCTQKGLVDPVDPERGTARCFSPTGAVPGIY
jgi:hypothetical protein